MHMSACIPAKTVLIIFHTDNVHVHYSNVLMIKGVTFHIRHSIRDYISSMNFPLKFQ